MDEASGSQKYDDDMMSQRHFQLHRNIYSLFAWILKAHVKKGGQPFFDRLQLCYQVGGALRGINSSQRTLSALPAVTCFGPNSY